MRLLGTAGAPPASEDAGALRERQTTQLAGVGADYEQAYASVLDQVPQGWTLLHVRHAAPVPT